MTSATDLDYLTIVNELKQSDTNFYNNMYLCTQNNYIGNVVIDGFTCKKFDDYNKALDYYNNNVSSADKVRFRHCFIPVFKYAPMEYDKYILKNKLRENYWKGNITILLKNDKKD